MTGENSLPAEEQNAKGDQRTDLQQSDTEKARDKLPGTFRQLMETYPEIAEAHENMAAAVSRCGPLDEKTCALIKIGISVGAGLESALRSHVRRAQQAGASEAEIVQAIFQGMNTVGFPRTVAAWSWAKVQFARESE